MFWNISIGSVSPKEMATRVAFGVPSQMFSRYHLMLDMEEDRTPVGRLDFKSSEGRTTSLVGSTPTLFRQSHFVPGAERAE